MVSDAIRLLVAVEGDEDASEIVPEIADRPGFSVETGTFNSDSESELTDSSPPDCVLTRLASSETWEDVLDRVRTADEFVPIVAIDDRPSSERATMATARGGVVYVDGTEVGSDELARRIETAAERFGRIQRHRVDSQQWQAFLSAVPYSVFIKDEQARHIAVSEHFRTSIGLDPIGKTDPEIWSRDGGDAGGQTYQDDLQVLETGEPVLNRLERIEPAEGDELWLLTSKLPWKDENGDVTGIVGISVDITEYKREEEGLRETTERLEQFTSFVSHDLRNPINVAQGYLEHSLATGDEAALERVAQALDQMEDLIDDLLTVAHEDEDELKTIPFAPLVQRTWRSAATGYLTLELSIPDGTYIEAVPGQLRQLLDNLFRNARDHAGAAVSVRVGLTPIGFYVEDDGDGIPVEIRDSIFDYGHSETGSGIGLAIVNEIAHAHGWRTHVTESPAGGARFEFNQCVIHQGLFQHYQPGADLTLGQATDIAGSEPAGDYAVQEPDDAITVRGGGTDMYGDTDEHYFVFGKRDGNLRIEARVADFDVPHAFSKAGIMIRGSLAPGSPLSYIGLSRDHGTETIVRTREGDDLTNEQHEDLEGPPRWYRIDWIDNNAICQTSADGQEWTTIDRRPFTGFQPAYFGLAVCSHDSENVAEATFDRVRTAQLVTHRGRLEHVAE